MSQVTQILIPLIPSWIMEFGPFTSIEDIAKGSYSIMVTTKFDADLFYYVISRMNAGDLDETIITAYVTHPDLLASAIDTIEFQVGSAPMLQSKDTTFTCTSIPDFIQNYKYQSTIFDETNSPTIAYAAKYMGVNYESTSSIQWDSGLPHPDEWIMGAPWLVSKLSFDPALTYKLIQVFGKKTFEVVLMGCILEATDLQWLDPEMEPVKKRMYIRETPLLTKTAILLLSLQQSHNIVAPTSIVDTFKYLISQFNDVVPVTYDQIKDKVVELEAMI